MNGNLPFLNDEDFSEPVAEAAAEQQPEPTPEPAESKGEPEAAPPAVVEETKNVPLSALLDERDKRKAKEAEAEELRRQLAAFNAQNAPPKADFLDDPEGALLATQQAAAMAAQQAALGTKMQLSRVMAEKDFGADLVNEAFEFFNQNPQLSQPLVAAASPYHEAVKVYQRHKALAEIGDDPVAFRARIERETEERLLAQMQGQPKPTAPPPSLAAASATAGVAAPAASGFDALFVRE